MTMMNSSNLCLSLTFLLAMTSLESGVWAMGPLFRAVDSVQRGSALGAASQPLLRSTRNVPGHMPCAFLSQLSDIKSKFEHWFDKDNNGRADVTEVKAFLQTMKPNVTDDVVHTFIDRRDQNGNGEVDLVPEYLKEFVEGDYGTPTATENFYLFDINDDGYVTEPELVRQGLTLGMSPEEAVATTQSYYLSHDADGDGKLSFPEFRRMFEPPTYPF